MGTKNGVWRSLIALVVAWAGCGSDRGRPTPSAGEGDSSVEQGTPDAAAPVAEVCGNDLDDDGDGEADEVCQCTSGEVRGCFPWDPRLAGVGDCAAGEETCLGAGDEFGQTEWGPCESAVGPSAEVCDGRDNDCDGVVDPDCGAEPLGSCDERCDGPSRVFFNASYGLWVQAVLCSPSRYDLLLGASESGPFRKIGDTGGHGQDHCELVNETFTIPHEDEVTSGTCGSCAVGAAGTTAAIPELWGTEMYVRSSFGAPFELRIADNPAIHTSCWYECGVSL